jgi:MFS family permease
MGVSDSEKEPTRIGSRKASDPASSDEESSPSWEPQAERSARWKVDCSVLTLLVFGLLVFQLDRMNLASALTSGLANSLGITQNDINLGNQLLYLMIVVFEIPCNMLLQKIGPRKWMAGQIFAFGTVATLQIFLRNRAGFLASRVFLGLAESGYIPGSMYTLSTWYSRRELARRIAILFFGMFGGNALSPLLASGILKLDGRQGLTGWQWLFLLEGLTTLIVSLLLLCFLPGSPDHPRPLLTPGVIRFSPEEQTILSERLTRDDPTGKGAGVHGVRIPLALVWKTVKHYRRWPHFVSTFCVFSTWSPLTTYTPSIIMSLGFDRISANALAAVGGSLALVVVFSFAFLSDKTNRRGATVLLAHLCYLIVILVARSLHPQVGKWARWGLWTSVNAFAVGYHPVHNTWTQLNCREPGERSITIW